MSGVQHALEEVLPEDLVEEVVLPHLIPELALDFLENDQPIDVNVWDWLSRDYPEIDQHRGNPAQIRKLALKAAPENRNPLIIAIMLGYFAEFSLEDVFYKARDKFDDMTAWLMVKLSGMAYPTTLMFGALKNKFYSTAWYMATQIPNLGYNLEWLAVIFEDYMPEELTPHQIKRVTELVKFLIDHHLAHQYRALDYTFATESAERTSVFEQLMTHMPALALHYIKAYPTDVVLNYLLMIEGLSYLHTAIKLHNEELATALVQKKPLLTQIRSEGGYLPQEWRDFVGRPAPTRSVRRVERSHPSSRSVSPQRSDQLLSPELSPVSSVLSQRSVSRSPVQRSVRATSPRRLSVSSPSSQLSQPLRRRPNLAEAVSAPSSRQLSPSSDSEATPPYRGRYGPRSRYPPSGSESD